MYQFTCVYAGGTYGSPTDYEVRCNFPGNGQLNIPPFDKVVCLVHSEAAGEAIIKSLIEHHVIILPERDARNWE